MKVKEYVIRLFLSTLSFRGVPTAIACKLRHERMEAIGDELSKGEYDIILLQEVCWNHQLTLPPRNESPMT
jgi:hypothetical protein